ncbi:hypothetical protein [Caulobacter flavus]|jgi:hypothetical protein|nr:hypothetical protein [Caulobacter flavus]
MEETTRNWLVCILFAVLLVGGGLGFAMHEGWITVDFPTATATPGHD